MTLGSDEFALLLPATNPDLVPVLLHRVARDAELGFLTFGLATCPGDAVDTDALIDHARRRRADAARAHEAQAAP